MLLKPNHCGNSTGMTEAAMKRGGKQRDKQRKTKAQISDETLKDRTCQKETGRSKARTEKPDVGGLTPRFEQLRGAAHRRQLSLARDDNYVARSGVHNQC